MSCGILVWQHYKNGMNPYCHQFKYVVNYIYMAESDSNTLCAKCFLEKRYLRDLDQFNMENKCKDINVEYVKFDHYKKLL